jgi:hypothetical protein
VDSKHTEVRREKMATGKYYIKKKGSNCGKEMDIHEFLTWCVYPQLCAVYIPLCHGLYWAHYMTQYNWKATQLLTTNN